MLCLKWIYHSLALLIPIYILTRGKKIVNILAVFLFFSMCLPDSEVISLPCPAHGVEKEEEHRLAFSNVLITIFPPFSKEWPGNSKGEIGNNQTEKWSSWWGDSGGLCDTDIINAHNTSMWREHTWDKRIHCGMPPGTQEPTPAVKQISNLFLDPVLGTVNSCRHYNCRRRWSDW